MRYFFCTFVPMKLYSDAALAKILDKNIFHQIGRVADRLGVECYVVGGYVRDIFLERQRAGASLVTVHTFLSSRTSARHR